MGGRDELWEAIEAAGAFRRGHFLLTSGRHSSAFVLLARAFERPALGEAIGRRLAARFAGDGVEAVVGPAMGGVLLAYEVARGLGARALFAEKADGGMALRRGFALKAGERVLVVEDVLTTGGSAGKVVDLVEERGARLVGVGVVVDRSGGRVTFGARRPAALFTMDLPAYEAEACPLCRQGVPLEAPKL